jgi:hypothetical protein
MKLLRPLLKRAITMPLLPVVLFVAMAAHFSWVASGTPVNTPWDQPAASLAEQIATILGPGQAHLTLHNLSTIPSQDLPAIRSQLEQDLRAHGITSSSDEAANLLRITLSENSRERLWIAEIVEGNETRVVMVRFALARQSPPQPASGITLHKQLIVTSREPVLAALETQSGLVTLEPERIRVYAHSPTGWNQPIVFPISQKRPLARDPRGILMASADGLAFEAQVPGAHCDGAYTGVMAGAPWKIDCHESDDPWPIGAPSINAPPLKAFYNATRDYFTGIVAPSRGIDLPAFYSAAWLPHAATTALLINTTDGKLQIVDNGSTAPVAGARDWGSDFAAIQSGCGSGTQIVASGSGSAVQDSLRAYEIPALEATPASAALTVDGSITALWTAPGGKSIVAIVRNSPQQGQPFQYEVDRVTATCN